MLNSFDDLRVSSTENDTVKDATPATLEHNFDFASNSKSIDIFVAPKVCNIFLRGHDDKLVMLFGKSPLGILNAITLKKASKCFGPLSQYQPFFNPSLTGS